MIRIRITEKKYYSNKTLITQAHKIEKVVRISEHILHGRTGLMGALARFLGGPGVVSPPATDSAAFMCSRIAVCIHTDTIVSLCAYTRIHDAPTFGKNRHHFFFAKISHRTCASM